MKNYTSLMSEEGLLAKLSSCAFGLSLKEIIGRRSIEGFEMRSVLNNLKALYPHHPQLRHYQEILYGGTQ